MRKIYLQNVIWKEGKYYVAQCLNVDISQALAEQGKRP